jgi:peptidoglycan/LPS O-acetylase OafA/YrhL
MSVLNSTFTKPVVDLISKIGYCSYAVYVIHTAVNYCFKIITKFYFGWEIHPVVGFFATSILSVLLGIFITNKIEAYFLKMRDKRFPSRVQKF